MSRFEHLLERHEWLRHARILSSLPQRSAPEISVGVEGFLAPKDAARVMGVSHEELWLLVGQGKLEAEDVEMSELWVRPAVYSVLGVNEVRRRRMCELTRRRVGVEYVTRALDDARFSRTAIVFLFLVSGVLGAVLGAILTAKLSDSSVAIQTTTVPGPVVTTYVEVEQGSGQPCSGTKVAGPPSYEPNDVAASAFGPLLSNRPIEAALEDFQDEDFYAFCVSRLGVVDVRVSQTDCRPFDESASRTWCNPDIVLLDEDGRTLAEGEVGEATLATLSRELPVGKYYVRINLGDGFRYELRVSAEPASVLTPTVPRG